MKNQTKHLLTLSSLLLPCSIMTTLVQAKSKEKKSKPNILIILSDDAGYADFGFQGSKQFKTPNLDKLCKKGVHLRQMYVTDAVSGPSRAGLMTGKYQERFGIEENNVPGIMSKNSLDGAAMGVPLDQKFIAQYLHDEGYECAAFGKWHLGALDEYHPFHKGFDHFVGFRSGSRKYYAYKDSAYLMDEGAEKKLEYGFAHFKEPKTYLTTLLGDEACKFIEENHRKNNVNKENKPFFMYLAFNAVHSPMEVDSGDMDKFSNLKGKRKRLAAMTYSLDKACGHVIETLKKLDLYDNTLIVFANDNGGPDGTDTSNFPLSGTKATLLEGGIRVPSFIVYPGVIKPNTTYNYPTSTLDLLPTFLGVAKANLDSASLADLDGVDLIPYLTGVKQGRPHQVLYWKNEVRGVVRDGDMKFMRFPDRPAELYDLSKDEGEHNNLASKYPDLIKKYYKQFFNWEMTLERPIWMLDRFCEKRVMENFYENPKYRYPKEEK